VNTDTREAVASPLFAQRLRERIEASGLSLRKLEKKSGVHKDTIGRWKKSGERKPGEPALGVKVKKVRQVAAVLGVTAEYLLGVPAHPAAPDEASRDDLLLQLSALESDLERLRGPAAEATAVITETLAQVSEIESLLPRLQKLAHEAGRIAPGE
jgi:transcriptional regulator with XRE-family HTH domain